MAAVDPKPNASPVLSAVDWIDKVQKIVKEALSNEETPFFIKSTLDRELNRLLERLQDARTQIHQGSADSPAVGVVSFSLETVGSLRVKISALGQGNHKTESIELVAEDEDELEQLLEEAVRHLRLPSGHLVVRL